MIRKYMMFFLIVLLSACGEEQEKKLPLMGEVDPRFLAKHISILSSDDFEGRAPFTKGEEKTLQYIENQFREAGLKPPLNDGYRQTVPLVQMTNITKAPVIVDAGGDKIELKYNDDVLVWTEHAVEEVVLTNSDLVFVGFGIIAPEYNWNDYEGIDVKGKTVVMYVNDPGYHLDDPKFFKGKAMTYYGRWTYKYEEAIRQGAAGVLIVHETEAASYGWEVIRGLSRPHFYLRGNDKNKSQTKIQGWISTPAFENLVKSAGMKPEELQFSALSGKFKPVLLKDHTVSTQVKNTIVEAESYNVIGVLPGSERPNEVVMYIGHWDHLGVDKNLQGDQIFNGAVDNATGIAALIEMARVFTSLDERPKRTVAFLAVTAEESGLLGSAYYAENPIYALADTVAVLNMDALYNIGATKDIIVIGYGNSELENYLEKHALHQGRYIRPDITPEKGIFYRSDHFNFAKYGVPALFTDSGIDVIGKGEEFGQKQKNEYVKVRYHRPADEYDDSWELSGIVQDVNLLIKMGEDLSNEVVFPNWYLGNEFRAIRDKSRANAN